jgi:hypothetical protein
MPHASSLDYAKVIASADTDVKRADHYCSYRTGFWTTVRPDEGCEKHSGCDALLIANSNTHARRAPPRPLSTGQTQQAE